MIYYGFFGNQRREKTWIDSKDLEFTIFCEAAKPSLYLCVRSYNWDDATTDINALSCLWQSWCYAGRGVGGWGVLTFKTLILLKTWTIPTNTQYRHLYHCLSMFQLLSEPHHFAEGDFDKPLHVCSLIHWYPISGPCKNARSTNHVDANKKMKKCPRILVEIWPTREKGLSEVDAYSSRTFHVCRTPLLLPQVPRSKRIWVGHVLLAVIRISKANWAWYLLASWHWLRTICPWWAVSYTAFLCFL